MKTLLPFLLLATPVLAQIAPIQKVNSSGGGGCSSPAVICLLNSINADTASTLDLKGNPTDGASAIAVSLGPVAQLANGSAKLVSIHNGAGGESYYFSSSGIYPSANALKALGSNPLRWAQLWSIQVNSSSFRDLSNYARIESAAFNGNVYRGESIGSGSGAIAHKFVAGDDLTGTGQKVAAFYNDDGVTEVISFSREGKPALDTTDASGTPGAATINKPSGTVSVAIGATSVVVTNSTVSTASTILHNLKTSDATCTAVKTIIPASGSFTITMDFACTAATKVGFVVFN